MCAKVFGYEQYGYTTNMRTYTISEFAKIVNKNIKTLQRWDRENRLIALRTITNRRYYTEYHINLVLKLPEEFEIIPK